MADNKLILFNPERRNIMTDSELASTAWDETGIDINEVAHSNRLNALLRQITTVTHSIAELVSDVKGFDIGSYDDGDIKQIRSALIRDTIDTLITALAPNKTTSRAKNTVWAAPASANGVPTFRTLVATDIPDLDTSKITAGTFNTDRVADKAITKAKLATEIMSASGILVDAVIDSKYRSVLGYVGTSNTVASYKIRTVTAAQYASATKDANTIYIITD